MVLLINACARPQSRTLALSKKVADKISDICETVNLYEENLKFLDCNSLSKRDEAKTRADFSDAMFDFAKQFQKADEIIIAAPYWDLSFPAILRCYIEAICVNGITFRYNEKGIPEGLCHAQRLIYVTTAGGFIPENNYGYDYIKQLCSDLWGIKDTMYIKAERLDIYGFDEVSIMKSAEKEIDMKFQK